MHVFSMEQREFIVNNASGKGNNELTEIFNQHFGLTLSVNQIKAYKKNHKISSGLNGRYRKGNIPYNKGTHIGGWEPTQFKKGNKPHNYLPIGTERINGDNYIDIKIADPRKWKGKHIIEWEKHNGPVPKGCNIIFGDRNNRNFNLDNLILVTKQQMMVLNQNKLIKDNIDLTRTGIIIADIKLKMGNLTR